MSWQLIFFHSSIWNSVQYRYSLKLTYKSVLPNHTTSPGADKNLRIKLTQNIQSSRNAWFKVLRHSFSRRNAVKRTDQPNPRRQVTELFVPRWVRTFHKRTANTHTDGATTCERTFNKCLASLIELFFQLKVCSQMWNAQQLILQTAATDWTQRMPLKLQWCHLHTSDYD